MTKDNHLKTVTVEIDGRPVQGVVAYSRGTLWVHLQGETFTYEVQKATARRGSRAISAASQSGEVLAPMPGKVIKLMVKTGEKVKTQQVLLIMEAMKMEYTLKAQIDGTVAHLDCEPGQQVALGQRLVKLDIA